MSRVMCFRAEDLAASEERRALFCLRRACQRRLESDKRQDRTLRGSRRQTSLRVACSFAVRSDEGAGGSRAMGGEWMDPEGCERLDRLKQYRCKCSVWNSGGCSLTESRGFTSFVTNPDEYLEFFSYIAEQRGYVYRRELAMELVLCKRQGRGAYHVQCIDARKSSSTRPSTPPQSQNTSPSPAIRFSRCGTQ